MRYDAFKRFIQRFIQRGALVPRFPLHRTLGPLGVTAAAAKWYLAGGISASACVAAYQPKGSTSLAASYTNLANPGTYNAAPGVAPTWAAATGWTFWAASIQHLKTGMVPGAGWSIAVRCANIAASPVFQYLCGVVDSTKANGYIGLRPDNFGNVVYWQDGKVLAKAPRLNGGVMIVTGGKGYRDGTLDGTLGGSVLIAAYELFIGGLNNGIGGVAAPMSGDIIAMSIYNTSIEAQVAAVSSAMAAL